MVYKYKGRQKYSSYFDKFYNEGSSYSKLTPIQLMAKRLKKHLPEEYRYSIPELMVKFNPDYLNPTHLKPLIEAFDKIQSGERVKFLVSVPPRHSKSEVLLHGIARYMATHRNKEVFYLSYAQDQAEKKSSLVRKYVGMLGLEPVKDTNSLATWQLQNGCTFHCAGLAGGQITGKGADLLVIDDPHKDRADVESGTKRERVYNSVIADVFTRLSPSASILIVHCIAKGEPILMSDGTWKKVESVKADDYVAAYEDGKFVSRKVLKTSNQGTDKVYKISTSRKSVRANARHPFLTQDGWKTVSELSTDDYILSANESSRDFTLEKITSVEEDGESEVYDLTVEGAENFIAGGFVSHNTRWHPDDLIGKMLKNTDIDFECLSLPAFNAEGKALWPERWDAARLEEQRKIIANEYEWSSLYMCNPRPRGSAIFNEPNYYKHLPEKVIYGIGYDLAYTAKAHADHSVAIVMATDGKNFYIVDVIRKQVVASEFERELQRLRSKYPKSQFLSYISGPEKGVVELFNSNGLGLSFLQANTDKFLRAQSVSSAWNAGKVLIPESAPWLNNFISEVSHFTGINDPSDDQIDALAGAFASLVRKPIRRGLAHLPPA